MQKSRSGRRENTGYAQHNQCRVDADYHSVILVDSLHHGIA